MNEFLGKNSLEKHTALIQTIIDAAEQDFDSNLAENLDIEAYNIVSTLKNEILDVLKELKYKAQTGVIVPGVPLRLSIFDAPVETLPVRKPGDKWRVGFLATTGNPVHWGHILMALRFAAEFDLNTIIFQVMGDHPHYSIRKQPKEHRHAIARHAVEYFYPLIRYTPLGYDNLKIGEENAAEFLLMNSNIPIDLYFLAGGDVSEVATRNIKACNDILGVVEDEEDKDLKIKLTLWGRIENISEISKKFPGWVIQSKRKYKKLPEYKNTIISSTLFRTYPNVPILPSRALKYIREHNLYACGQKYYHEGRKKSILEETVLLSYLTPTLHQLIEKRLTNACVVEPLIPHGPSGKKGLLGQKRITVFKAAGKETSILPLMRKPEVKTVLAIGLCGALQSYLKIGDIIFPTAAIRGEGITAYWADRRLPAVADYELIESLRNSASNLDIQNYVGLLYTTASLARERQILKKFASLRTLGVEMELALHYTLAMLHNKNAASIYVVSDNIALGDEIINTGISESPALTKSIENIITIIEKAIISF